MLLWLSSYSNTQYHQYRVWARICSLLVIRRCLRRRMMIYFIAPLKIKNQLSAPPPKKRCIVTLLYKSRHLPGAERQPERTFSHSSRLMGLVGGPSVGCSALKNLQWICFSAWSFESTENKDDIFILDLNLNVWSQLWEAGACDQHKKWLYLCVDSPVILTNHLLQVDNIKPHLWWCEWVSLPDGVTLVISRHESQRFKHKASSQTGSLIKKEYGKYGH